MGHVAQSMASGGHPEGAALVTRHDQLAGSLARLQRLAASRQAALVESVCRLEYESAESAESAELEEWVAEQQAAASSEDYGQDYEHLLGRAPGGVGAADRLALLPERRQADACSVCEAGGSTRLVIYGSRDKGANTNI
ncbi:unnamed protein product [Danaus chrysippus]|uniref:(African queen) hypothetical protein n=1 Tax=Danaus chrysippus TaxID=151541 RepID=A0A8J2W0N9_9NEOP|nr:unnamed protein product [Danaus chrysippus]